MRLQLEPAVTPGSIGGPVDTASTSGAGAVRSDSSNARGTTGGDSIRISGTTTLLNRMSAERAQRLEQLASLIRSGAYYVSSAKISGALVDHALSGSE